MNTQYVALEQDFTTQTGISQTPGITFDQIPTFIYTLLFGCIIAAVVVRLFIAGVLRIGSSQSSIKKSSDVIHHAVWGVFLVIFMILFVALVNRDLLRSSIDLSGFRVGQGVTTTQIQSPVAATPTPAAGAPAGNSATGGTEAQVRATLQAAGITINKAPCVGANTSCTNVANLQQEIITMLLSLKNTCSCDIQVTGGTEPGHSATSNHTRGAAVDLGLSPGLTSFLIKNGSPAGSMTGCNIKYSWGGFIFWNEPKGCSSAGTGSHYHISRTGR